MRVEAGERRGSELLRLLSRVAAAAAVGRGGELKTACEEGEEEEWLRLSVW